MNRLLLIAALSVAGAISLEARTTPLEMEEASEAARRAATAAIHGPRAGFLEALDVDALLEHRLGTAVWRGLTAPDREILRATLRERLHGMLAPPRPVAGEVAWSAALPASSGVDVLLGLNLEEKTLKTRWVMRRSGSLWRVGDVSCPTRGFRSPARRWRRSDRNPFAPGSARSPLPGRSFRFFPAC